MKNKILVMGATGNIGSHLVELLKEKGADFVAATSEDFIQGVDSVSIDFADVTSLEKAMHGISTLFMLLPVHPDSVQWGRNIIKAAKKSGVSHIVRSSSHVAYKAPSYDFMKLIRTTDEDVINSGLAYTIIAPQYFMQNFSNFFADDYKNGTLYLPAGKGKIAWIDVRDIAAVSAKVLQNPKMYDHKTLTITGSESLSYDEAIGQMNEVLGKQAKYIEVPDDAAINAMQELQFPDFLINVMMDLNHAISEGSADEVTQTVETITGKKPISFKQFIADYKEIWA